jgi:hypothetical protein
MDAAEKANRLKDRIASLAASITSSASSRARRDPRAKIASFENVVNAMTHDASTLGGNSGSAVIDVQTGQLVALHFAVNI